MIPPPVPPIGRQAAARLARAELSKPVYHRPVPLAYRIVHTLIGWLGELFRAASRLPGGWWSLVGLAALAVIAGALIIIWTGPLLRARRRPAGLATNGPARTASDHRQSARRHAQATDYAAAICESLRAIAAELDERGVLPTHPGRTADEFAVEAGQALGTHAADLRAAAALFDEIRYGQRPGSRAGYQRMCDLDEAIRTSVARRGRAAAMTAATSGNAP